MIAVLLSIFAGLCWAAHDQFARLSAERVGPLRTALAVMILGGGIITPYVLWHGAILHETGEAVLLSLGLGVGYALGAAGIFKAFSLGPVSIVAPLTSAYPIIVLGWRLISGVRPTPLQWVASALTLAGAVVVGRTGRDDGGLSSVKSGKMPTLVAWCLLSAFGYATAVIMGQRVGPMMGNFEATWVSRFSAALTVWLFIVGEPHHTKIERRQWGGILAMAILDAAGITAVNASGAFPEAEFAAIGITIYAGAGVVMAALFLRERVSFNQWIGVGTIVLGVVLLGWPQ